MGRAALHFICVIVVAVALAGCSVYKASRSEDDDGGHQPDGSYVLTAAEQAQDCRGLQSWIRGYADSVRKLTMQQAVVQSETPRSLFSGLTRLSGQREATGTAETMCRQYAVMLAMNRELADRGCEMVDIAAVLADPGGTRTDEASEGDGPAEVWGVQQAPSLAEYQSASAPAICGSR